MFLTWLPDVLRDSGVRVNVMQGAEKRSSTRSGLAKVNGIVWHDTVTPKSWSNTQVRNLLRDGHSNLKGPLSQVGLERDGLWTIVALGKCNHNGYGLWGNDAIGIEMFNAGGNVREVNPTAQVESALVGTAAILAHLGMGVSRVKGHKETDPTRKQDPWGLDMHLMRWRLHDLLTKPKEQDMDPIAVVILTYNAILGRNPETLQIIAEGAEFIKNHPKGERQGQADYVVRIANSDEAKARPK